MNEFDDLVETIKSTWPDNYHAQGIAGAVIKKGWISPSEATQRELHHFETEKENAGLREALAEMTKDRDLILDAKTRVEINAEKRKKDAFEAGKQAGQEQILDEVNAGKYA